MSKDRTIFLATKEFLLPQLLLILAGCGGGGYGGGNPPAPAPVPTPTPTPPPPPPPSSDFQLIQDTVFTPICAQCHIGANAPHGLRLDAANSYALLVNVASDEVPNLLRVNPGNPDQSYIVQKIEGTAAVGARMPLGQAKLPQDKIDLIRGWITAGAPQAVAPPGGLVVSSSIPASGEVSLAGMSKITVVFNHEVDASLAVSGTFELRDGMDQPVAIASARVPAGRANVVELNLAHGLDAGSYQLRVRGEGEVALADTAGRVLNAKADGETGSDFLMSFDVGAGASR